MTDKFLKEKPEKWAHLNNVDENTNIKETNEVYERMNPF